MKCGEPETIYQAFGSIPWDSFLNTTIEAAATRKAATTRMTTRLPWYHNLILTTEVTIRTLKLRIPQGVHRNRRTERKWSAVSDEKGPIHLQAAEDKMAR